MIDKYRAPLIFVADLMMAAISLPIAVYLRLGAAGILYNIPTLTMLVVAFVLVAALVLWRARLHRIAWRYVSVDDALLIATTAVAINLFFLAMMFFWTRLDGIPRSSVLINILLLTAMMIGSRLLMRVWHERRFTRDEIFGARAAVPVLLIGATDEAEAFILTTARDRKASFRAVGIINTGTRPVGGLVRGVTVLGNLSELEAILTRFALNGTWIEHIIIADPSMRGPTLHDIVDIANSHSIKLNRLPAMSELHGAGGGMKVRPVDVTDLLSRPQAELDQPAMLRLVGGRRILVTGAGGSIGSELVRQIAALKPAHLTLLELSEYNLYEIDRQIGELWPGLSRTAFIGDVRDAVRVEHVFSTERPDLVFHTAALKHVPLLETHPSEAVLTNVLGTCRMADACIRHDIEAMVLISTDKAAHPVSVMGASKRIAESYCQSLDIEGRKPGDERNTSRTRFVTVRFGNVLGSAGSVVPLFQKQLESGGPLTVTHPQMTRYFMTIREAVELVLEAATLKYAGLERGHIVVLDMGEPVNILTMATQMIKLAGLRPDKDIKIAFTGLRPGERLTETLFQTDEELVGTGHAGLMVGRPQVADHAFVGKLIDKLHEAAVRHDDEAVLELLNIAVAGFADRHTKNAPIDVPFSGATQYSEI